MAVTCLQKCRGSRKRQLLTGRGSLCQLQMPSSKLPSRTGFQITLKSNRFAFVAKGDRRFYLPWHEFSCMGDSAGIVAGQSVFEVFGGSYIVPVWIVLTHEDVDVVEHRREGRGGVNEMIVIMWLYQ